MGLAQGSAKPGSAYRLPAGRLHLDTEVRTVNPAGREIRTRTALPARLTQGSGREPEPLLGEVRQGGENGVAGRQPEEQNRTPHEPGNHNHPPLPADHLAGAQTSAMPARDAPDCRFRSISREAPPRPSLGDLDWAHNSTIWVSKLFPGLCRRRNIRAVNTRARKKKAARRRPFIASLASSIRRPAPPYREWPRGQRRPHASSPPGG